MIAQANAGGRYGDDGGGFVARVAPARAAVPSFNSAASGSFGSGRMVYSGERFSPTTLRSPSSPAVRQYYINSNSRMRPFSRTNIDPTHRPPPLSNGGNRPITNVRTQRNGSGPIQDGKNL